MQMIDHIILGGAIFNYMDVEELTFNLIEPWNTSENTATRFARDDTYERQLTKAKFTDQQALGLAIIQASAQKSGEYEAFLCEFDATPANQHTFARICQTQQTQGYGTERRIRHCQHSYSQV